ncbi:MAG TPA: hypothetical protein VGQ80_05480, partial [Acidimicrobiia bacterium]|nr:hypothetical protein [Acidimicrobiia bacterium]
AVVLAGKARRASSAGEAVPLAVAAAVTAGILGFGLARARPGTGMGLASAALVAAGALFLGATFARPRPRPTVHRLQDFAALAAAAVLVLAALAAGGVFSAVAHLGR